MKTALSKSVFALFLLFFVHPLFVYGESGQELTTEDQVRILVPAFNGGGSLGKNVANVLGLQISQTFRGSDANGRSLGTAVLLWDENPLKQLTHDEAMHRATDIGTLAQLVLWGTAVPYGDGVVVQSYLTVSPLTAFRNARPEVLTIQGNTSKEPQGVSLDIPTVQYNFRPIVLRRDIVDRYQNRSLPIYSSPNLQQVIGTIGREFRALEYRDDLVYLRSGSLIGWVPLPELADSRSEIVSFTSALIRILRGDWPGARELLRAAGTSENLPQAILIDITLYNGLIEEKLGQSGLKYFYSAYELNRFNEAAARYVVFGLLSEKFRLNKLGKNSKAISTEATTFIQQSKYLFANDDPWLKNVRHMLETSE